MLFSSYFNIPFYFGLVGWCPTSMAEYHPDLIMCRKKPVIMVGRMCEKCDGNCGVCDECNYGRSREVVWSVEESASRTLTTARSMVLRRDDRDDWGCVWFSSAVCSVLSHWILRVGSWGSSFVFLLWFDNWYWHGNTAVICVVITKFNCMMQETAYVICAWW